MEIIERENVNVANTLIVKKLTFTEADSELETFLQHYGSIQRNLIIDDPTSEFHRSAIVEYAYSSAVQNITPMLPLTLGSLLNPSVTFQVRALSSVCRGAVSGIATEKHLGLLKLPSKESRRQFSDVTSEFEELHQTHIARHTSEGTKAISCLDPKSADEAPVLFSYSFIGQCCNSRDSDTRT